MLTGQVAEPMAVLSADFVGPLPRSKRGNTMHDAFAKRVELVPLKRATATLLQGAFRERILGKFRIPKRSSATVVCSRSFRSFMGSLGVDLQYTAPYSPQEKHTERTNRTVKTMISQYARCYQSSWDELLPEMTLAINSSVADSKGFSPSFLMLGREPRLLAALYDEVTGSATKELHPDAKQDKMREVFAIARNNLQRASTDRGRERHRHREIPRNRARMGTTQGWAGIITGLARSDPHLSSCTRTISPQLT